MIIKNLIICIFPTHVRIKLKKWIRTVKSIFYSRITISDIESILINELGIEKGDKLFVTSSFGNLNADFSPKELLDLLIKIVGYDGGIVMPYYPPGTSIEWAKSNSVFDVQRTISSTGVLSNILAKYPGSHISLHPTKAVVEIGCNSIIHDHYKCKTPYGLHSPYERLLHNGSKSIGLGTFKMPMGHCFEDLLLDDICHYYPNPYILTVRNKGKNYRVKTYVHNMKKLRIPPSKFIKQYSGYKCVRCGASWAYSVDNIDAYEYYKEEFAQGRKSVSVK